MTNCQIFYKYCSHRGQTQSQYLNFGDTATEGKAEAEATSHGSRAIVGNYTSYNNVDNVNSLEYKHFSWFKWNGSSTKSIIW